MYKKLWKVENLEAESTRSLLNAFPARISGEVVTNFSASRVQHEQSYKNILQLHDQMNSGIYRMYS